MGVGKECAVREVVEFPGGLPRVVGTPPGSPEEEEQRDEARSDRRNYSRDEGTGGGAIVSLPGPRTSPKEESRTPLGYVVPAGIDLLTGLRAIILCPAWHSSEDTSTQIRELRSRTRSTGTCYPRDSRGAFQRDDRFGPRLGDVDRGTHDHRSGVKGVKVTRRPPKYHNR